MKRKTFDIFAKVFSYTMLILVIVIGTTAIFFSSQITTMFENSQRMQFSDVFSPLMQSIQDKTDDQAARIAADFHNKNTSFEFCIQGQNGEVVYRTTNFKAFTGSDVFINGKAIIAKDSLPEIKIQSGIVLNSNGFSLQVQTLQSQHAVYNDFIIRTIIAVIVLLCLGGFCALSFARYISKPIKTLAQNTTKMANLEFVSAPVLRRDEIGQMSNDVYRMYEQLKYSIQRLKAEVERERQMEESQRYFFTAASHELKTPIAGASALLEGMLENIIDVKEYPETLRECLKLMNEQNKLVNEILGIVQLENDRVKFESEEINLKMTVTAVLQMYTALAEAKGQNILNEVPDRLCANINKNMFKRVLSNVIMNAIQNTPEKGGIKIWTKNANGKIRLSVFNSGTRIPDDILPKLFEPFYRADKARSKSQGRSGLGLTIVKKALNQMNIPFSIENTDTGVLFWMDLPQK